MSPQALEAERIALVLEGVVARLGVLPALDLRAAIVDLRALGEEWEQAMDGLTEMLNRAMDEQREAAA